MFEDLRRAFREAVENFKRELNRDRVPEAVDRLVVAMRKELRDAQLELDRLEAEIRETLQEAETQRGEADTCRRREEMAREIGDDETVEVAREFAAKHQRKARVLERKALALREEHLLRQTEVREMRKTVEEAAARRSELAARAGRAQGRETIREADRLFDELSRMEERIDDLQARADAAEILSREEPGAPVGDEEGEAAAAPPPHSQAIERRLQELKRRMGVGGA